MDIGPGDFVECIDATSGEGEWLDTNVIVDGQIYLVSDMWIDCFGEPAILVGWEREVANRAYGFRCGYWVTRFRPIYTPKPELFSRLLEPVTDGVTA